MDTYSLGSQRYQMAKRRRQSYSDEYKRQAVDLVLSSGRSAKSVSKELGLDRSGLSRWAQERSTVAAGGSAAAPTSLDRFTDLLIRKGFRIRDEYDSRCWLGWRPASDGPTDFQ